MLAGEMSLWQYQAIMAEWQDRQPKDTTPGAAMADDGAPVPTQADWDRLRANVARATKGA